MPTESVPRSLLVEVRRGDYQRAGQIDDRDIADLTLELRLNNLGAWSITLPAGSSAAQELRVPGAGLVATLDGEVLLSGPLVKGTLRQRAGEVDVWVFEGVDDSWVLADLLAWPYPTSSDVTRQGVGSGYDVRTGPAESVIRAYVERNVGPLAPASRRVSLLDLQSDGGRGRQVTGRARFDVLGELLSSLATVSGLVYRVRASGDRLLFEVTERRDLRKFVRFDVEDDTADDATYSFEAPGLTRAIVAGQGEAAARLFAERSTTGSLSAEALWGRRRERFIDRRDVSDQENGPTALEQLQQAGDEALAEEGETRIGLTITPVDTVSARFWADWRIGDLVSATVGDVTVEDVVSEATVKYGPDGLSVTAVLGDPNVAARGPLMQVLLDLRAAQQGLRSRTGRLERQ